ANPAVRVQSQAMSDLKKQATSLGMTLESRSKLALNKVKNDEPEDPFKELMNS
ncbi:TPA: P27 family phage terminase small subunit, partial [Enterococcus faecium]|nr:P27 family phage terminase small subunit [Enterococcus faecium]